MAEVVWIIRGRLEGWGRTLAEALPDLRYSRFWPRSEKVSVELPVIATVVPSWNCNSNHESGSMPSMMPPCSFVPTWRFRTTWPPSPVH